MATQKNNLRMQLLSVDAFLEGATGVALVIVPQVVSRLLFAAELDAIGMAMARVAGIALFSLSVGCWLGRQEVAGKASALVAMLIYNLLVTPYLVYIGIGGTLVGILLWPAAAVHAFFTLLLAYALMRSSEPTMRKS
jgi:hypothetical protein